MGGLRGNKGTVYEGGLRVPGIIEWPNGIPQLRITKYPAVVMDIFPTIAEIVGLPDSSMLQPQDGVSLVQLFTNNIKRREKPIPFHYAGNSVMLDNNIKLLHVGKKEKQYELYDLAADPNESHNLYNETPEQVNRMQRLMNSWVESMNASIIGKDYPEGRLLPGDPAPRFWMQVEAYKPFFKDWKKRPEYKSGLQPKKKR